MFTVVFISLVLIDPSKRFKRTWHGVVLYFDFVACVCKKNPVTSCAFLKNNFEISHALGNNIMIYQSGAKTSFVSPLLYVGGKPR